MDDQNRRMMLLLLVALIGSVLGAIVGVKVGGHWGWGVLGWLVGGGTAQLAFRVVSPGVV